MKCVRILRLITVLSSPVVNVIYRNQFVKMLQLLNQSCDYYDSMLLFSAKYSITH